MRQAGDESLAPAGQAAHAAAEPPQPARPPRGGRARAVIRRPLTWESLLALVLGLLVLLVHDVGYVFSTPYWTDESWVAVTTRYPLSQLLATTNSTPIGFSVLVRVFTVGATESARVIPLAFAGAAVIVGYWFGRRLSWRRPEAAIAAGVASGVGVLLVPGMLHRNDLKQYTADAFFSLLVLALTSRLERQWSRRGLAWLSVAIWGGMLFSDAVAFVGAAAFGALCVVQIARRDWARLAEAAVAGAGTAVLMLGVYEAFDSRAVTSSLVNAPGMSPYYAPVGQGLHALLRFVVTAFDGTSMYFGLGPLWLAAPLFLAGLVTIFRLGRPATAVMLAVLWPEMIAISAMQKYPFLEPRTSTFLYAVAAVVAAVGVIGICSLVRPWLQGGIALGLAAAAVLVFAGGAQPYIRSHTIPLENVRGEIRYVAAHAASDDVILVNLSSNWNFAYYWPVGRPSRRPDPAVVQGYESYFPGQPRIVIARNRNAAGVGAAVSQALAQARAQHGSCSRIWLVRSHVSAAEAAAWSAALRQHGLSSHRAKGRLRVIQLGGPRCG